MSSLRKYYSAGWRACGAGRRGKRGGRKEKIAHGLGDSPANKGNVTPAATYGWEKYRRFLGASVGGKGDAEEEAKL